MDANFYEEEFKKKALVCNFPAVGRVLGFLWALLMRFHTVDK